MLGHLNVAYAYFVKHVFMNFRLFPKKKRCTELTKKKRCTELHMLKAAHNYYIRRPEHVMGLPNKSIDAGFSPSLCHKEAQENRIIIFFFLAVRFNLDVTTNKWKPYITDRVKYK